MTIQLRSTRPQRVTLVLIERTRHHREAMAVLLSQGRLPMIARPHGR